MHQIAPKALDHVTGGFTRAQQTLGKSAVKFAQHKLHTSPVFLGDVTNSVKQRVFTKQGVMVSTGDEANPQFGVWRALMNKAKGFTGLKDL